MMWIVVGGVKYDLQASVQKVQLVDLMQLKVQQGIGLKEMMTALEKLDEQIAPEDMLDDERVLRALIALIWLARRHAGDKLTLEQAGQVPIDELGFESDEPEEEEVEDDPKAPTDSGPDASDVAVPVTGSTTSNSTSTSG